MPSTRYARRLKQLLNALQRPQTYIAAKSYASFLADRKLQDAVTMRLWLARANLERWGREQPLELAKIPVSVLRTLKFLPAAPIILTGRKLWKIVHNVPTPLISALEQAIKANPRAERN